MGEFLRRIREAQGIAMPAPQKPPLNKDVMSLSVEAAQARLNDLRIQIAGFGSPTVEDRRLLDSLEARIAQEKPLASGKTATTSGQIPSPQDAPMGPIAKRKLMLDAQRATS